MKHHHKVCYKTRWFRCLCKTQTLLLYITHAPSTHICLCNCSFKWCNVGEGLEIGKTSAALSRFPHNMVWTPTLAPVTPGSRVTHKTLELLAQNTTTKFVTKPDGMDVCACVKDLNTIVLYCTWHFWTWFLTSPKNREHSLAVQSFSRQVEICRDFCVEE